MKILYIANARIPTEKAHGVNIMHMCQAFSDLGHEVVLLIPDRIQKKEQDPWDFHGVRRNFSIVRVPVFDAISRNWLFGYWVVQWCFSFMVLFFSRSYKRNSVVYTRDEVSGWLLRLLRYRVFYDMHGFPENKKWFWKISMKSMLGITATNHWKMHQTCEQFGISMNRMLYAPNGFDPEMFSVRDSEASIRKELNLSFEKKIVLYSGQFYDWKGVCVLAEAAKYLPKTLFVFVGGSEPELSNFTKKYGLCNNICVFPRKPHKEVARFLHIADVLVLPNSALSKNSRFAVYSQYDTSPIKMFEYMASGKPIVSSNLPSITEILNEKNAVLVEPDHPEELFLGIERVLKCVKESAELAKQALEDVSQYSWNRRAAKVAGFMGSAIKKS